LFAVAQRDTVSLALCQTQAGPKEREEVRRLSRTQRRAHYHDIDREGPSPGNSQVAPPRPGSAKPSVFRIAGLRGHAYIRAVSRFNSNNVGRGHRFCVLERAHLAAVSNQLIAAGGFRAQDGSPCHQAFLAVFRRRTPGPPPFSSINSMPAVSNARRTERSLAAVIEVSLSASSARRIVATPTADSRARSSARHRRKALAALI
jgi:hypothetical protein